MTQPVDDHYYGNVRTAAYLGRTARRMSQFVNGSSCQQPLLGQRTNAHSVGQEEHGLAYRKGVCCRDKVAEHERHQPRKLRRYLPEGHHGILLASDPALVVTVPPNLVFVLHPPIRGGSRTPGLRILLPDCFTREGVMCEELSWTQELRELYNCRVLGNI